MTRQGRAPLTDEHEALLAVFLAEETARGRRPRGVECLSYRVRYFLRFLDERGTRAHDVTLADAHAYQGELLERHAEAGTVIAYVNGASVLCSYLAASDRIMGNPFDLLPRVRRPVTVPRGIPTERETVAILCALTKRDVGRRLSGQSRRYVTHVVAELQYASGLRIAEVAALTPHDVDVERALVYVRGGKHGSNRVGFLTEYAADVLEVYMNMARPELYRTAVQERRGKRDRATLLFHTNATTLATETNHELRRACTEAGVPAITSHGFRHALGYHLLRAGCTLRYIQAILGHKYIADTEVYTKVDVEDVKRVFDECHPRMHG